jgi:hypothetical protein
VVATDGSAGFFLLERKKGGQLRKDIRIEAITPQWTSDPEIIPDLKNQLTDYTFKSGTYTTQSIHIGTSNPILTMNFENQQIQMDTTNKPDLIGFCEKGKYEITGAIHRNVVMFILKEFVLNVAVLVFLTKDPDLLEGFWYQTMSPLTDVHNLVDFDILPQKKPFLMKRIK